MNTPRIQSFPFSADAQSKVLILGSMPGVESLRQQQYYAHPRNLFWDFMGELFGTGWSLPYDERLKVLRDNRIALWDVAHSCRREGSLDANMTAVEANDFNALFTVAPNIHCVFFNGQKATALFRKLVVPDLQRGLKLSTLPSTSPANASVSREMKKEAWTQVRHTLRGG
jgi:hypoxanthine-DNA glycosylase